MDGIHFMIASVTSLTQLTDLDHKARVRDGERGEGDQTIAFSTCLINSVFKYWRNSSSEKCNVSTMLR
jgi:hypothetical protein